MTLSRAQGGNDATEKIPNQERRHEKVPCIPLPRHSAGKHHTFRGAKQDSEDVLLTL